MERLKVLVFDLDDTLHPELAYVRSGFAAVARNVCGAVSPERLITTLWNEFQSGNRTRAFDAMLTAHPEIGPVTTVELVRLYREHIPQIVLPEEARDVLSWARRSGLRLAIISDGYFAAQNRKIEALGLADLVDLVVLTDQWGHDYWKPHDRAFKAVEEHFGVWGASLAYVGDNASKDFVAPNQRGWRTVHLMARGQVHAHRAPPTPQDRAIHLANSLTEVRQLAEAWI